MGFQTGAGRSQPLNLVERWVKGSVEEQAILKHRGPGMGRRIRKAASYSGRE